MSESLYFIAIIPSPNVQKKITDLKHEVSDRFNSKMALKSPGHITMHMPFRWKDKRKNELMVLMEKLNDGLVPFEVQLKDFGFFEPRVVYVNVVESEPLRALQKRVVHQCRTELKLLNSNYKDQVFRPHVTIAFRDLKKPIFEEAQKYFKNQEFHSRFTVKDVSLLKHDGTKWRVCSETLEASKQKKANKMRTIDPKILGTSF
ncbi:MAG: 2'-5' RNA ligase family protein [Cytophagales bacterium]|nr:2'-5' RNA ligase family protein [Cytophagales bacterium]